MMMPILDQGPAHHHHGHGHQTFYHQQHIPEQAGKMQLTLLLPNGVPSVLTVDAATPMMDLLVQATSINKLSPSAYSLVVIDSNQHIIHFKPNQTVGQIINNCQLPQVNGSSAISLLPKETQHLNSSAKSKTQPFEITVRLQVNLPDGQKILLRIDPTLPLHEIKEQICKQKKYVDSARYVFRLPTKLDQPLLHGLSLAEYKTNELTLVRLKNVPQLASNNLQSFDRLYRTRSESQPPTQETNEEATTQQQTSVDKNNNKQRPASVQLNPTQNQDISVLPTRPITSHTTLHAYWNDPNFDTQSQTSNCSSSSKKRRAPKAPGFIAPIPDEQQIDLQKINEHRQSHESLTESTKQKRKAPILPTNVVEENTTSALIHEEQPETNAEEQKLNVTIDPIEHQQKLSIKIDPVDEQRLLNLLSDQQASPAATLVITTHSPKENVIQSNSQTEHNSEIIHSTETQVESHSSTPIYSQVHKTKEIVQNESPYSAVQLSPTPPVPRREDIATDGDKNYSVAEIVQAGIADPPPTSPGKSKKAASSVEGLTKIVTDHKERAQIYQESEKQNDNVSYFRVAKSRCGKFETENQGFVNNSTNVFESTVNNEEQPKPTKQIEVDSQKRGSVKKQVQQQTNGKQAYELLKKYEKDEPTQGVDTEYLKTSIHEREKSPTPIQLEVTERTTHISVTVETDGKQLITRASPIHQTTITPAVLTPKPYGKTITEYRTVRRMGSDGEIRTTTTVHTETVPSNDDETKGITTTVGPEQSN